MNLTLRPLAIMLMLTALFGVQHPLLAQEEKEEEVYIEDLGRLPESFDMALDTLLRNRYSQYYNMSTRKRDTSGNNATKDELYRHRLYTMESAIPLTYNSVVREAIDLYVSSPNSLISRMLAKSTCYFPMIEEELDRHGLPLELKYLAIVESALNPTAVSRMGASGLWQFMVRTAKVYGLHVGSLVDERLDPRKSTEAMCKYFKEMYALYGDWMLAIAAYNCGPGNVNKAIRRSNGSKNFWKIYPYLPRETRSYVPFFIAAFYSMEYYKEHNITPQSVTVPIATDTIHVHTRQTFQSLSKLANTSVSDIQALNPQYKRQIIPGNQARQVVVLPASSAVYYAANKDSIMANDSTFFAQLGQIEDNEVDIQNASKVVAKNSKRYYTVRRGDTLSRIAAKHRGTSVAKIRKANGIRGSRIRPGQRLVIP